MNTAITTASTSAGVNTKSIGAGARKETLDRHAGELRQRFTQECIVGIGIDIEEGRIRQRFTRAGLITIGKTNLPEFAIGTTTEPRKFGPTHIDKISDSTGNYLGLDRDHDADSKDDIVTSTFSVPVNRPVQIVLRSKDVTHSFWVRELRLKQDAVPGMMIPLHFTATTPGRYEIACVELCGLGHYKMRAFFQVQSDEEFAQWLQTMAEAQ